jgi:large subunit ribosomal protein L29
MKNKSKNIFSELNNMTQDEVIMKINNLNNKIIKLKMYNSIVNLKNPLYIRNVKREIAKLKTYLNFKYKNKKNEKIIRRKEKK